jgi:hypothetical protein
MAGADHARAINWSECEQDKARLTPVRIKFEGGSEGAVQTTKELVNCLRVNAYQ